MFNTMNTIEIKSLPVKKVIRDIAKALDIDYKNNCGEYTLTLPPQVGSGWITGIDTKGGLGVLLYDCTFKEETRLQFSINDVHPLKFLYLLSGSIEHYFENDENNVHEIEEYQTSIVGSHLDKGHILLFRANTHTRLHSLEIDRKRFSKKMKCELKNLTGKIKSLFEDVKAENHFYFKDHFSLELAELFKKMYEFEKMDYLRKIYLEGMAYQILIKQIVLYLDSEKEEHERNILRTTEVEQVRKAVLYIEANITDTPNIEEIGREVGLNQNKLQQGFKILYNNTVNRYIHKMRLEMARYLLLRTEYSISEIAERIGLNSKSYFSKIFRESYNISPSEYREKNKSSRIKGESKEENNSAV